MTDWRSSEIPACDDRTALCSDQILVEARPLGRDAGTAAYTRMERDKRRESSGCSRVESRPGWRTAAHTVWLTFAAHTGCACYRSHGPFLTHLNRGAPSVLVRCGGVVVGRC